MSIQVFTIDELYDLVSAENSALNLEKETGIHSAWYDFADENQYNEKIKKLGAESERFEEILRVVAIEVKEDFNELSNLLEFNYEIEDYLELRENIQSNIIDKALIRLGIYCY